MAANQSYDRLPSIDESQDIVDVTDDPFNDRWQLRPLQPSIEGPSRTTPSPPAYSRLDVDIRDRSDRASLNSFETQGSSSSFSSIAKIKYGFNRIRRKPVPGYLRGSIRRHPAAEIHPTRIGRGVWKDQLLVDRSIRGMAFLTFLFAVAMVIVVGTNMKSFYRRANKFSSSVGGETRNCKDVTQENTALLLLINVAATIVLGMSNTYQQLVTSLKISDIKHMLKTFGDSRVGTNSPFSIQHKESGKRKSWAAWILLVCTSLPVHFLANSLIGPSYILQTPPHVSYNESSWEAIDDYDFDRGDDYLTSYGSFVCWSAFRTGVAHFPESLRVLAEDDTSAYGSGLTRFGTTYGRMVVQYSRDNCTGLANSTSDVAKLEASYRVSSYSLSYSDGQCKMGSAVYCSLFDSRPAQCRLNVRMNAAFILAACLVAKAIYMIGANLLARGKLKTHLLTFGDVLVASASHPELRVQGECMVNAGYSYRRQISHTCHKHCKSKEESKTGDEIGHCQNCKKWNTINKHSDYQQPTIATKLKKSLISSLGNTALTQMSLLMICSIVMLSATILVGVQVGTSFHGLNEDCKYDPGYYSYCNESSTDQFAKISGGFGGFNKSLTVATLAPGKMGNELLSFCISNGAQFIYSLLYLMLIYNMTCCSQEHDWGKLEHKRKRLRCTMVKGESFSQDYLLQLPKKLLFPIMAYSVLTHWMLGEALQTQEAIWMENIPGRYVEHSKYIITYAAYPLWIATFLILLMTAVCWWAFTYKREGFIPTMFGSIRALCAATTQLDDFPNYGIQWGDLGMGKQFRHAGLSAEDVMKIQPNELYAGIGDVEESLNQSKGVSICLGNEEEVQRLLESRSNEDEAFSVDKQAFG